MLRTVDSSVRWRRRIVHFGLSAHGYARGCLFMNMQAIKDWAKVWVGSCIFLMVSILLGTGVFKLLNWAGGAKENPLLEGCEKRIDLQIERGDKLSSELNACKTALKDATQSLNYETEQVEICTNKKGYIKAEEAVASLDRMSRELKLNVTGRFCVEPTGVYSGGRHDYTDCMVAIDGRHEQWQCNAIGCWVSR